MEGISEVSVWVCILSYKALVGTVVYATMIYNVIISYIIYYKIVYI